MPIHEYTWVLDRPEYCRCGKCGGWMDTLKVQPERSPSYINYLLLCRDCGHVIA